MRAVMCGALLFGCASALDAQTQDPIVVRGGERIAWEQQAPSETEIRGYRFVAYTGDTALPLSDSTCRRGASPTQFDCSAALPSLPAWTQWLQVSAATDAEG